MDSLHDWADPVKHLRRVAWPSLSYRRSTVIGLKDTEMEMSVYGYIW